MCMRALQVHVGLTSKGPTEGGAKVNLGVQLNGLSDTLPHFLFFIYPLRTCGSCVCVCVCVYCFFFLCVCVFM